MVFGFFTPSKPYCGNLIGKILVKVYQGEFRCFYTFKEIDTEPAPVYKVKWIFPFWMNIIGQAHGEYIFIHEKIWNTPKQESTQRHEYVHVWQSRSRGWVGIPFIVAYVWYLIRFGYKENPFEVEAREKAHF
jgi:hypothetical protein